MAFCPNKWNMIQQDSVEEITKGGIIITEKTRKKMAPARGKVIAAGKDNKFVHEGDHVIFSKDGNCFTDIVTDEEGKETEYVFVAEEDIVFVGNREYTDL